MAADTTVPTSLFTESVTGSLDRDGWMMGSIRQFPRPSAQSFFSLAACAMSSGQTIRAHRITRIGDHHLTLSSDPRVSTHLAIFSPGGRDETRRAPTLGR
jgi:hypothetical protein